MPTQAWDKPPVAPGRVAEFAERILKTEQTPRLQQRDVPAYLHQAVAAHLASQPAASLVGVRA